jgi:hypothetical protein
LIEYLKTLPQDAAVYIADGEAYRFVEDYPDWDERDNASFPIEIVSLRKGLTDEQRRINTIERGRARAAQLPEKLGAAHMQAVESIAAFVEADEPAQIVTLIGCR